MTRSGSQSGKAPKNADNTTNFVVVGGGLAGLTTALALAKLVQERKVSVDLVAPVSKGDDRRTTAFLHHSVEFMEKLGVWQSVAKHTFPLKTMRIVDGTSRLVRAPQVDFKSSEIDLEAFGYNVENRLLIDAMEQAIAGQAIITRHNGLVREVVSDASGAICSVITDQGEEITGDILVAADGRESLLRSSAGIGVSRWSYDQQALVMNFSHTLPHNDTSTEFHTETGPFTAVPLGHNKSSLVWVVRPDQVDAIMALDTAQLETKLEEKMQSFLGKVSVDGPIQGFPLSGLVAKQFGRGNVVLAGEAAHVFPPIGAQGFNLGLRDIEEIIKLAEQGTAPENFGNMYHRARMADVTSRTFSVDLLNRSLLSSLLPVQMARSLGLFALGTLPPLRQLAMRQGVSPDLSQLSPFSMARKVFNTKPPWRKVS